MKEYAEARSESTAVRNLRDGKYIQSMDFRKTGSLFSDTLIGMYQSHRPTLTLLPHNATGAPILVLMPLIFFSLEIREVEVH